MTQTVLVCFIVVNCVYLCVICMSCCVPAGPVDPIVAGAAPQHDNVQPAHVAPNDAAAAAPQQPAHVAPTVAAAAAPQQHNVEPAHVVAAAAAAAAGPQVIVSSDPVIAADVAAAAPQQQVPGQPQPPGTNM